MKLTPSFLLAALLFCNLAVAVAEPCGGVTEYWAHRGHWRHAENSAAAVLATLDSGFTGAEIDVQLLGDRHTWALHHDLTPGRVVKGISRDPLLRLSVSDWRAGTIADDKRHSTEPTALLEDVLAALKSRGLANWRLVIEIKGVSTSDDVRELAAMVHRYLPPSSYVFTSLEGRTLGYLRAAQFSGELQWVVIHPRAANRALSASDRGIIERYGKYVGMTVADVDEAIRGGQRLQSDGKLPGEIVQQLGQPVAVQLDWDMLDDGLIRRLRSAQLNVATYSADDDDSAQAEYLGRMIHDTGFVPAAVILSSDPAQFCRNVERALSESDAPASMTTDAHGKKQDKQRDKRVTLPAPAPLPAPKMPRPIVLQDKSTNVENKK